MSVAPKEAFARRAQERATAFAGLAVTMLEVDNVYKANNYDTTNPIGDGDLVNLDITAAQLSVFVTLCQQLGKFLNNNPVTRGAYQETIDRIRTDYR